MLVQMEISSFAIDPQKSMPLVILKETGGGRSLVIPIEPSDAKTIAMQSLHVRSDKPNSIDLVMIVIEQLGGVLNRVVINDVLADENVFSASIIIHAPSALKVIDCKPCDAIMLAMRCGAPIFVRDAVFFKLSSERGLSEEEQLRARVRAMDTVEFGRYVLE